MALLRGSAGEGCGWKSNRPGTVPAPDGGQAAIRNGVSPKDE